MLFLAVICFFGFALLVLIVAILMMCGKYK